MINHPSDLSIMTNMPELVRLANLDRNWVKFHVSISGIVHTTSVLKNDLFSRRREICSAELLAALGSSIWLHDGPKLFRPTHHQCQSLEQIDVRLKLEDYAQPYPAILIDIPIEYKPVQGILCFLTDDKNVLIFVVSLKNYPVGFVAQASHPDLDIEESFKLFASNSSATFALSYKCLCEIKPSPEDVILDGAYLSSLIARAIRIAANSCLALVNYGSYLSLLLPKEVENDRKLSSENTERGMRARERLKVAIKQVNFRQNVILHRTVTQKEAGERTGKNVGPHWRRGHWAMQTYGPKHTLRKRILRPAVFVRQDLLIGKKSDSFVTYETSRNDA